MVDAPLSRSHQRLSRDFYALPTPELAQALLGQRLVRQLPDGTRLSGLIVETEAYHGMDDSACHARVGETKRTSVMFGEPAHAYVYLIYGMYHMLNISANPVGFPGAVLIRGVLPLEGIDQMFALRGLPRGRRNPFHLTNGPGKLCKTFRIDQHLNAVDLVTSQALWLERETPVAPEEVLTSPRIGIEYAAPEHRALHWRFCVNSKWMS